ncbi:hypothetical protein B0H19DRAFT_1262660 [Mycena capillaripes]|nr:hypothetical protein B0H19DRAFT_1262660 [Mycena capillaripes]
MSPTSTPTFRVRQIEPPTALEVLKTPELGGIVDTLSRAFSTDAFTAIVTGHRPHRPETNPLAKILCRSSAVAGLLGGEVYVAETMDPMAKMVGCAVWFGPGRALYDSDEQVQLALQPLLASFSKDLKRWWDDFLPEYIKYTNAALGEGLELASWRLQTLAVSPECQRKGVATLLVDAVIKKAAITKTPLCVDCSEETNVEIYQRLGFELMPKGMRDLYTCRGEFTGMNGDCFYLWVLSRA